MTWNYRLMRRTLKDFSWIGIYEVYYDKEGRIEFYSEKPISPYGETKEELEKDIKLMSEALKKPILEYNKKIISQKL